MKKYDDIVVGSGISGLTMTLLLGMSGRRVLLLEKGPSIGGSLSVFRKNGIPFDTGFHFTGGLQSGGLFDNMLAVLGLHDAIQPLFLPEDNANSFFLESDNALYEIPYGIENIRQRFSEYFPSETAAVNRYFDLVLKACRETPSMDLRRLASAQHHIDEDFISLEDILCSLTSNPVLKALLSGFAMCYGVRPKEISFANHSRICIGLYESVARIAGGGASLIGAFSRRFSDFDIEVSCGNTIASLAELSDQRVGRFVLETGEEVEAENCVFTIHPKEILKLLPAETVSKAFIKRVSSYESSTGFFALFGSLASGCEDDNGAAPIVSIFPHTDINLLLEPGHRDSSALVLMRSTEIVKGEKTRVLNVLETSSPEHVEQWKDTKRGARPASYYAYKQQRSAAIQERIFRVFPHYRQHLKVLDSASVLTFRDYLNSPDGSAYGIRQKIGQYNLFGKLPLRNLYAAGQSSLLPGIIGAMMSSFIVGRSIIKDEKYMALMERHI